MEGGAGGLAGALPLHPGRNLRFLHLLIRARLSELDHWVFINTMLHNSSTYVRRCALEIIFMAWEIVTPPVEPALRKVEMQNIFSFKSAEIDLSSLNVLVGPNGAGKSNLLKAIAFIGEIARSDLIPAIERFGGYERLLFGGERKQQSIKIRFESVVTKHASEAARDIYELSFTRRRSQAGPYVISRSETLAFKRYAGRGRRITVRGGRFYIQEEGSKRASEPKPVSTPIGSASAGLATLRRLGEQYGAEQANDLATLFENFRVFEVDVRRATQPTLRGRHSDTLLPNASNLSSYLFELQKKRPDLIESIVADLNFISPSILGMNIRPYGAGADEGFIVELREAGLSEPTPLAAASFGTVRALALFTMLHDPNPPRLTCVEEVDHGLHPYALDRVVERLRTASSKTQIIAVTHSPALVNRLEPHELKVFEKDVETGETLVPKFDPKLVAEAGTETGLGLGEMWFSGAIGGIPA
jgi:predicted ATPase